MISLSVTFSLSLAFIDRNAIRLGISPYVYVTCWTFFWYMIVWLAISSRSISRSRISCSMWFCFSRRTSCRRGGERKGKRMCTITLNANQNMDGRMEFCDNLWRNPAAVFRKLIGFTIEFLSIGLVRLVFAQARQAVHVREYFMWMRFEWRPLWEATQMKEWSLFNKLFDFSWY